VAHASAVQEVTMADQAVSTARSGRAIAIRTIVTGLGLFAFLAFVIGGRGGAYIVYALAHARLHWPDWRLIAEAPWAIRIHLATVAAAVVLTTVQVLGPKGTTVHRTLGWALAVLLVTTAIAALFIRNPGGGLFNPFQVFSLWTLIAIPWGIASARKHNVRRHASLMYGFYFGGMILAGLLAFLPGRLMWRVFFG
jgi:uncharacterized membrane protein